MMTALMAAVFLTVFAMCSTLFGSTATEGAAVRLVPEVKASTTAQARPEASQSFVVQSNSFAMEAKDEAGERQVRGYYFVF